MDGWKDGRIEGWMDNGWIIRWMEGWIDGWMRGCLTPLLLISFTRCWDVCIEYRVFWSPNETMGVYIIRKGGSSLFILEVKNYWYIHCTYKLTYFFCLCVCVCVFVHTFLFH